jgi:HAE1 family hydrophobic/amphiphilic exporter-1
MFSRFFINRPIFASVLSILIVLAGIASYLKLPVSQYPEITPPVIRVTASYPGANAQVVADTVATAIEQQVNGVENMLYMSSTSASDGSYALDITFQLGTDVDIASVLVQNRVATALPRLPEEVQRQGVLTRKQSTSIVQVLGLSTEDGSWSDLELANFAILRLRDVLLRIDGVGDVQVLPAKDYAMRIWMNPKELKARGLTTSDVVAALREQNVQVAAGQIGQPPAPEGQVSQFIVTTLGRLTTEDEFRQVIVKTDNAGEGRITRLGDVARIELGARAYDSTSRLNGRPSATLLVYQQPGANAVQVARDVEAALKQLKVSLPFPAGLDYFKIYDVAAFVEETIDEVYKTFLEAIALVIIVVLLFLQNWRTTLIPIVTIPVSLIGTFSLMLAFGFSINLLTLFGLILAIGIVVDDAIVVVENVERHMAQDHLPPRTATIRAMGEVLGPIIAISLVLMSVFGPAALLGGITGQLYRQFALTIAASTLFSALNALTLSPALCAVFLKQHSKDYRPNILARGFNRAFAWLTRQYRHVLNGMTRFAPLSLAGFAVVMGLTYWSVVSVPTGFLPLEDQGFFVTNVQLPDAASLERTTEVVERITERIRQTPGVAYATGLPGFSIIAGAGSNNATIFATLKPWDERLKQGQNINVIMGEVQQFLFTGLPEAQAFSFQFPPIPGLGAAAGFDLRLLDRESVGRDRLAAAAGEMVYAANEQVGRLANVNTTFRPGVPQLYVDIDRTKVKQLGIPLVDVFQTLQSSLGSTYVNDFNLFGRSYQVNVQAEAEYRNEPDDILHLEVRAPSGEMVPLGSLLRVTDSFGPQQITRYNLFPSAQITGQAAQGTSSGEALALMERIADEKLESGIGYEWSAISYQEKRTSGQGVLAFAAGIIVVYLILAAQYESWSLPLSVAMSIPLAIIGAMLFLMLRGFDNNVFTQIGLVLLVALAAKNAILIVEFARVQRASGKSIREAAVEAATLRFRPILMTSFAFILGCLPLMLARGAGAVSRQAIGTAVVGGMLGATILGVLFAPVLYVVVQWVSERVFGASPALPGDRVAEESGEI